MLVQALAAYADTYLADQLADLAFEEKPVPFAVQVYDDGAFCGIRPRQQEVQRGKKTVLAPMPLAVPRSPVNRNSTLFPLLGCDAIQYVVGPNLDVWTKPNEEPKHRRHHEGFVTLVRRAAEGTGDDALRACAAFYADPARVQAARDALAAHKPGTYRVTLAVVPRDPAAEDPGGPVVDRAAVRAFWRKHYAQAAERRTSGQGTCLVSGRTGPIAATHDKIKGVSSLGGQPAGVSLMSFDKEAFRSYGWKQNANSPVCPDRAAAYVLALNDLLRPGKHRRGASRDTVVRTRVDRAGVGFLVWTREPTDDDVFDAIDQADPEAVERLLLAPEYGAEPGVQPNDFYLLAVSGNGARLQVWYWFHDTLTRVRDHVRSWFADQRIADVFHHGQPAEPPKLWQLLLAISPPRVKVEDKINAERSTHLVRRALQGLPLGRTILAAALSRLRVATAQDRLNPVRIGLLRMCVNDILSTERKGDLPMPENLDQNARHPGYVCGRLLAVYDKLQYAAQGQVNVTVADRYYAMASTHPQLAMPKLETLSKAHLRKLRRERPGAAFNIDREVRELMGCLNGSFPARLSLEDQGRFVIGYHHQRAHDAQRAAQAKAAATAESKPPRTEEEA